MILRKGARARQNEALTPSFIFVLVSAVTGTQDLIGQSVTFLMKAPSLAAFLLFPQSMANQNNEISCREIVFQYLFFYKVTGDYEHKIGQ